MKGKIFFLILNVVNFSLLGQQIITPQKKIYQDKNGKTFVNKNLGLYFKISTSPNKNSEHYLLKSEDTPQNTNPLYFANEGLNIVFSPWEVDTTTKQKVEPKKNIQFEIYADATPPVTKIHNNTVSYEKKDTLFFGKDLRIWFTSTDNLSGIENTYISINGQDYQPYKNDSLTFANDNYYTLKYYSTDNTGNIEQLKSVSFIVDSTKPLTNLVVIGTHLDTIVSINAKVALKPMDAFGDVSKTYYYIDDFPEKLYSQPISVSNLSEGLHSIHYYSVDAIKNKENIKSWNFYIDNTPPMIVDELVGDYVYMNGKSYTSGRSQIQLTALDNKSGLKSLAYSIDGKTWIEYDKPFTLPTNVQNLKIYFYAEDNVGNKTSKDIRNSSTTKLFASEMDLTPPDINIVFNGPKIIIFDSVYISGKTNISIAAKDTQSGLKGIDYTLNESESILYDSQLTINREGKQKLTVFATDNVNNISTNDYYFNVDTLGPQIYIHTSLDNSKTNILPANSKIFLAASDNMCGVDKIIYTLNNGTETIYSNYLNFSTKGKYELKVKAIDLLGNETVRKFLFEIR